MWDTLAPPWQAAIELAWEAYCAGTVPIGAVVTDPDGNSLSCGRNRIFDTPNDNKNFLAHAELDALFSLNLDQETRHRAVLYTTMEPCPLCMGAFYMSGVRTLHYASRDPYAGSTNLLGSTPYLSVKPIRVVPPFDRKLEISLIAMFVESEMCLRGEQVLGREYFGVWRCAVPQAVDFGIELYHSGGLRCRQSLTAKEIVNWLVHQVQ